jgi:hypothetical protein
MADRTGHLPAPRTGLGATRRRRRAGDVLLGLVAFLALAALVAGVPAALLYFVGSPVPERLPSLDALRQPVTSETLVGALGVLVWLAWAQFTACVLVEVKAAVSGAGMPARVRGAALSQTLARQLVTAVLLLSAGTASSLSTLAPLGHADRGAIAAVTAPAVPGPSAHAPAARGATLGGALPEAVAGRPTRTAPDHGDQAVRKLYTVQPPRGRHHDSLWEIAERHLGDGRRYREIFELNKERVQPDGSRLTMASLIRPGWVLTMPADAVGEDLVAEATGVGAHGPATGSGHGSGHGGDHGLGRGADHGLGHGAGGHGPAQPHDHGQPLGGDHGQVQGDEQRAAEAADAGGRAPGHVAVPADQGAHGLADELAAASLLAAGLLAVLGRRRRRQLWNRLPGRRVHLPAASSDAAAAEEALRVGADPDGARFLDTATRDLSAALADAQRPLPSVCAARLRPDSLELLLAPADPHPPTPWVARDNGRVWSLAGRVAGPEPRQPDRGPDPAAPYPGLVSVGTDGASRVLVDLEAAGGVIALQGPPEPRRAVLAAAAAELATNRWSDGMTVTMVGFGDELAALAPGRVQPVASLEELLPQLEAEAAERSRTLAASGIDSVLTGRLDPAAARAWTPRYVIVGEPPNPGTAARLAALAVASRRTGVGYLVAGDVPGATWTWEVDAGGRLRVPLLGLDVEAQQLPARQYAALVALFHEASQLEGDPTRDPPPGSPAAVEVRLLERPAAVDVRLLGPPEVLGAAALDGEHGLICLDMLVYLALHRDGVHPGVLAGAVWPRGVPTDVRDAAVARLRDWLGEDLSGRPHLEVDGSARLRLGPGVRSDWEVFTALRRLAAAWAAHDPVAGEQEQYLAQALALVRGPFLAGRPPRRFAWLAHGPFEAEIPAAVSDAALRLASLRRGAGDPHGAVQAVLAGMRASPDDEELWRELLRATHDSGDIAGLQRLVKELQARTRRQLGDQPSLHPRTEALVDELLPWWRLAVAN